ncbi:putative low-density lipoprotein receptor-related protein 2 [Apostichopus japonicus]|uniref:Putative low-density lipoprotein receptor-related protein 2 n=1 Tax=Stichopus japonicus TaxID=307972 RepID=A0A2G8L5L2_STIJA|nr:putative low-density lipoprotein receptor-related protein 2 [Apostichopus japonicus]
MPEDKLYWVEARLDRLERCNLDGSARDLLIDFTGTNFNPFGLAVLPEAIFWTDWSSEGIDVSDRNFLQEPTTFLIADSPTRLNGISFHRRENYTYVDMDCSFGRLNSSCNELCLLTPGGRSCVHVSPIFHSCPNNIDLFIQEGRDFSWQEPLATSPSGADVTVTSSHEGGGLFVIPINQTIMVSYNAIDVFGNSAICFFNIYVVCKYMDMFYVFHLGECTCVVEVGGGVFPLFEAD